MHPSACKPAASFSVTVSDLSAKRTLCPPAPRECPIRGRSGPVAVCETATYSVTVGRSVTLLSSFLYFILPPKGQWLTLSPGQMTLQWHHSSAALESLGSAADPPSCPPLTEPPLPLASPARLCTCGRESENERTRLCVRGARLNCIINLPHAQNKHARSIRNRTTFFTKHIYMSFCQSPLSGFICLSVLFSCFIPQLPFRRPRRPNTSTRGGNLYISDEEESK